MNCSRIASAVVDLARGVALDASDLALVRQHLRGCPRCAARLERERTMSALLRRAAEDTSVPPLNARFEAALLTAFDNAQRRRRLPRQRFLYATAAAAVLAVATITLVRHRQPTPAVPAVVEVSRRPSVTASPASVAAAGESPRELDAKPIRPRRTASRRTAGSRSGDAFITWPGASDLPAFESGQLMRVQLPASVALSLGLAPSARARVVQADVLVGQDGFARAIRLAP
jgi:hypothetical protein